MLEILLKQTKETYSLLSNSQMSHSSAREEGRQLMYRPKVSKTSDAGRRQLGLGLTVGAISAKILDLPSITTLTTIKVTRLCQ